MNKSIFLVAWVTAVASFVGFSQNASAKDSRSFTIEVTDPRPLASAAQTIEKRHSWVITYEDPPYAHKSEILDVTKNVRRDLDKYKDKTPPPVLIPKGGSIKARYKLSPKTVRAEDMETVLIAILKAHRSANNPGDFKIEKSGNIFHIIPIKVKGKNGKTLEVKPLLDTPVTFKNKKRSGLETLSVICSSLSEVTKQKAVVGTVPINRLRQQQTVSGSNNEPARAVLARLLSDLGDNISWQLFYDPGLKWYVLNIHIL